MKSNIDCCDETPHTETTVNLNNLYKLNPFSKIAITVKVKKVNEATNVTSKFGKKLRYFSC